MKPETEHFQEALHHIKECTDAEDLESLARAAIWEWATVKTKTYLQKSGIQLEDEDNVREVAEAATEYIVCLLDTKTYPECSHDWEESLKEAISQCGTILDQEEEMENMDQ